MSWELIYLVASLAILPLFIIAVLVSARVEVVLAKYAQVTAGCGLTAKELVERIAREHNLLIRVEEASAGMGDHYDPHSKAVRLTAKHLHANSVAALAVAAHECGHALQDEQNYLPLKIRQVVVHVSNFTSRLLTPLIIFSFIATIFVGTLAGYDFMKWVLLGLCLVYGLAALLQFITLPVEFDASRRGKKMLRSLQVITDPTEQKAVNQVLHAAANTYVVAFALSAVYFLRYLAMFAMVFDRRD